MNILPKKSWHVRNKDNVARVRRDEENARIEEEKRLKRIALAEQEARTNLLRQRAKEKKLTDNIDTSLCTNASALSNSDHFNVSSLQPLNLFAKEESGTSSTNKEHEKEKKLEQEKYEKKLGILTYLGQSAVEAQEEQDKPWYFKPKTSKDLKNDMGDDKEIDLKRKSSLDPLSIIPQKYKKAKHKHKKKHKKENKSDKKLSIKKLREERLKREAKEKLKAQKLLKNDEGGNVSPEIIHTDERQNRYNSQFNPQFIKKKKSYDSKYH